MRELFEIFEGVSCKELALYFLGSIVAIPCIWFIICVILTFGG